MTWRMTDTQRWLHRRHYRWWTWKAWRSSGGTGVKLGPISLWWYRFEHDRAIYVGVGLLGRVLFDTGLAAMRRAR